MAEQERPSERLVEQRPRNRVMESLEALSQGDDGVRAVGVADYVEEFVDQISDDLPWDWRNWSCFTPSKVAALDEVRRLVVAACDATRGVTTTASSRQDGPDESAPQRAQRSTS